MIDASESGPHVVRLRFRSDRAQIPIAVDRVLRVVEDSGCVLGQEIEVALALREALDNAVVHGNHLDPEKWVQVRCCCDADGVEIVVRDEGHGFDAPPNLAAAGCGQPHPADGLLIMRSFMDQVSFERGGAEVHLRKEPALGRVRSAHADAT